MESGEVRHTSVQALLSRKVHDSRGDPVGRIEEIRAAPSSDGAALLVEAYVTGGRGAAVRLSARSLLPFVLRLFRGKRSGYVVPWDQMDLSDPEKPRTLCPRAELRRVGEPIPDSARGR